jgi:hypothetical protein
VDSSGVSIYPHFVTYGPRHITCDRDEFDNALPLLKRQLEKFSSFRVSNFSANTADINSVGILTDLIGLDVIQYNDSWSACERQMNYYLDETFTIIQINVTADDYCSSLGGDWIIDPCCNGTLCCATVAVNISVPQYSNITAMVGFILSLYVVVACLFGFLFS